MSMTSEHALPSPEEIAALPPDGGPQFNRLIHEKSPYLLQHARNPVDWYPWGAEAFEKAKREDKPVFLSVGYSTCHWCHVMERESFETESVAEILNRYYVCIKVDREERPDIDEIYMSATQLLTNRGGWPNSVWLMPDGRPWYAGTYFPPEDVLGRPGFKTVLVRLAEYWNTKRHDAEAQAEKLTNVMRQISSAQPPEGKEKLTRGLIKRALDELGSTFDEQFGGFGSAPKFPPYGSLNLIFHEYRRKHSQPPLKMATHTLDMMARGGIRDQMGGGFHRYSTDARWLLPHFEKMLYDNAQLTRTYTDAYLLTQEEGYRTIAMEICEWVLREMTDETGGFYSALDADSEGVEGKFYVWKHEEIIAILGETEGGLFSRAYGIEPEGNFHEEATGEPTGTNIPHLPRPLDEVAQAEGISRENLDARLDTARRKLLEIRNRRVWPHLDDKILTSWNGLMIGSLAYAGRHLGEPRYTDAAARAADFILHSMRKDGRLLRTYREGEAKLNGYLDDYAFFSSGLLDLHEATGDDRWLTEARTLIDALLDHYWDREHGGFFFTSEDHELLLSRPKDPFDKAIPSGNGIAAQALIRLARLTGEKRYVEIAQATLDAFLGLIQKAPRGADSLLLAISMFLDKAEPERVKKPTAKESADASAEPDAAATLEPVTAEAFASRLRAAPGETVHVAVRLAIDDGWHINSNAPLQEYLKPTTIGIEETPALTLGDVRYPEGKSMTFPFNPQPLSVYDGEVFVVAPITIAGNAHARTVEAAFEIAFQACDESRCLAQETLTFAIPIEVAPGVKGEALRHRKVFESIGYDAAQ